LITTTVGELGRPWTEFSEISRDFANLVGNNS